MITKDGRDLPIEKLTPENYIVPKGEEKSYHCTIEVVKYDPNTGKKLSKPRVQKFGKKMFETLVLPTLKKQGYTVNVLHNPNEWLKEQKELAAKRAKEQAEAKTKADKEKFDAAVADAVAKELAKKEGGKPGRKAKGTEENDN